MRLLPRLGSGPAERAAPPEGGRRRRLAVLLAILLVHLAALGVTYQSVLRGHTLVTGTLVPGPQGDRVPWGYPGTRPAGVNVLDPGASGWGWEPQVAKAHAMLAQGHLPLWSANTGLGAPLAADATGGLYDPLTWPLLAHPSPGVWDAWLLLRLLLVGLLTTLLAAALGLRPAAATLAGVALMLGGAMVARENSIQVSVTVGLPLTLLGVERSMRRADWWAAVLTAAGVAQMVLAGMPEETFLCGLLVVAYALTRLGALLRDPERRGSVRRSAAVVAGGAAAGALLSLPLVVPLAEYLAAGATSHGAGSHRGLVVAPVGSLLEFVAPFWSSSSATFPGDWIGVVVLALALLGVRSRLLPRGVATCLTVVAALSILKEIGVPDILNRAIGNLPLLERIVMPQYLGPVFGLCIALLAGAGVQRLWEGRAGVVEPLLAALAMVLWVGLTAGFLHGPVTYRHQVAITAGALLATVACLAAGPARRLLGGGRGDAGGTLLLQRRAATTLGGVALVELVLNAMPVSPLPLRHPPLTSSPSVAALARLAPSGTARVYGRDRLLYPTTNQAFDIDSVENLDAIYVERYQRYIRTFVDPGQRTEIDRIADNPRDHVPTARVYGNPFLDALNVAFVEARGALPPDADGPPPPGQLSLVAQTADGVSIYRNLHASPRALVMHTLVAAGDEAEAMRRMQDPGFDPRREAVVEAAPGAVPASQALPPDPVAVTQYQDQRVEMTTSSGSAGVLVLADADFPGWTATVDGRPATILPANLALRGVAVPAGRHTVVMEYRPASVTAGALGAPAGVASLAAAGLWSRWRRRRRGDRRL